MTPAIRHVAEGRLRLYDLEPRIEDLCEHVAAGLRGAERKLSPKFFYDEAGAHLFERICELEAYYPTRTELAILREHLPEIAAAVGPGARLVEFGSGSGIKTQLLLEHLDDPIAYLPIDISRAQLIQFSLTIAEHFPELEVLPLCADYTADLTLPKPMRAAERTVAFFPGSTIGNFEPAEAEAFLRRVGGFVGEGGALLIGVDLQKDAAVLNLAYNDPEGVTAQFNLNLLRRINAECGADFDLARWRHHAFYDGSQGRVEMRLVSEGAQQVRLTPGSESMHFAPGEHITTEFSYKHTLEGFRRLAARTGWRERRVWTDERPWFSVWMLERSNARTDHS